MDRPVCQARRRTTMHSPHTMCRIPPPAGSGAQRPHPSQRAPGTHSEWWRQSGAAAGGQRGRGGVAGSAWGLASSGRWLGKPGATSAGGRPPASMVTVRFSRRGAAPAHRRSRPERRQLQQQNTGRQAAYAHLAAGQHGLQQVGGVHRAVRLARAQHQVNLVDEQDDLQVKGWVGNRMDDRLKFERTPDVVDCRCRASRASKEGCRHSSPLGDRRAAFSAAPTPPHAVPAPKNGSKP